MLNLEKIFNAVDNLDPEEVMDLMKALICIDTSVPPGKNYRQYINTISPFFKELGYSLEEVIVPEELVEQIPLPLEGPRVNLVATKDFGQDKYVTFYGHIDVVPAPIDEQDKWRFPPFKATMIKSGKIYGRGTSDMKGAMVCLILALRIVEKLDLSPKFNIRIVNCTDEEVGHYPGVRYLAEKGYLKDIIFCMELAINPIIPTGAAGSLDVIIETIGKSCHSGMNFLGVNALEEMIPIMNELINLKKEVEARQSKDILGLPRPGLEDSAYMSPMFNLDIIRSGEKSNIVPASCVLTVNRRIIPDENYEDVKKEILEAVDRGKEKSKALDVKTTFNYMYPALQINPNTPPIKRIKKVMALVQKVPEDQIKTLGMAGSVDMSFVSEILNIDDIIIHGIATLGSNAHGVNENVKLKDMKTYIKELIVFLCADI
ncbi:MAG: M20 family peptidase [Promethearchaeota archaeon]|nr:MAG: M20 family peptidase [Candidatus Lokiarchaeota archaeon]